MLEKIKNIKLYKKLILSNLLLIAFLFFFVILLGENASLTLYLICFSSGMSSLLVGQNNSISTFSLGLGKTRKETEYNLIKEIVLTSFNTIILIGFDLLFIFIVNKSVDTKIRFIIFTYLLSLLLCLLSNFVKMNYKNIKLMIIPLTILLITIGIMFINNFIIIDIIILALILGLYFINRYNIYNKVI